MSPTRNKTIISSCVPVTALLMGMLLSISSAGAQEKQPYYTGLEPNAFMTRWVVLAPVPVPGDGTPDTVAQKEAFDRDWLESNGGESGILPVSGGSVVIEGRDYEWRSIDSSSDIIDLNQEAGMKSYSIAYAWAEVEFSEAVNGLLGIGSDDSIKVWVNGKRVHDHWIARGTQPDADLVPVEFIQGKNQILLKIQNIEGGSGFACRLLSVDSMGKRLVAAARAGDLDTVRLLIENGADIQSQGPGGLTAAQAARLRGQQQLLEFLEAHGAEIEASLPPPEVLTERLFTNLVNRATPGAAVLVSKNGQVLFENGYGSASLEHGIPVTPETKFRIGSVSKQFIAAAILKLHEEGRLDLEDTLSKFIPDYPRGDEVTIHHLLAHTSGIRSFTSKPDFLSFATVGAQPEDHINSFKNDPFDFDPGTRWSYNNSAYFLLGWIIEKVSGKFYGDYLRDSFFAPLGMTQTGVHEASAILPGEATGYSFENGKLSKALNWDMSKAGGAGSLYSTVRDLHLWNEAIFNGRVLKPKSIELAFTPVKTSVEDPVEPKDTGYAYGWSIQWLRDLTEIGHGGGLHGFLSYLLRLPRENLTVAVLANCAPPYPGLDPGALARDIAEFYLWEKLAPRIAHEVASDVSTEALDSIVGRYDYGFAILTVSRKGERIFAQLSGQPEHEIFPKSETKFFWKVVEAEVAFEKDQNGSVTRAIHRQGGQTIHAPRIQDQEAIRLPVEALDAVTGRYDYGGGIAIMTVSREGERIFAQLTGQPRFEIFASTETDFFWRFVHARISFKKDPTGKVIKAVHQQAGQTIEAPRISDP